MAEFTLTIADKLDGTVSVKIKMKGSVLSVDPTPAGQTVMDIFNFVESLDESEEE